MAGRQRPALSDRKRPTRDRALPDGRISRAAPSRLSFRPERAVLSSEVQPARAEFLREDPNRLRADTVNVQNVGCGERCELLESSDSVEGELATRDLAESDRELRVRFHADTLPAAQVRNDAYSGNARFRDGSVRSVIRRVGWGCLDWSGGRV